LRFGIREKRFAVCTIHRAENTDDVGRLTQIIDALNQISKEIDIVFPIHPRTRKIIADRGLSISCRMIDPVGYLDMVSLLTHSSMVLTDSGGLQKEAYFFGKPCVTLRDETEWTELIEGGFNVLAGSDAGGIVSSFRRMCATKPDYTRDLYGGGTAGKRIVSCLLDNA